MSQGTEFNMDQAMLDLFAAHALTGILAGRQAGYPPDVAAGLAYEYAAAMVAERKKMNVPGN